MTTPIKRYVSAVVSRGPINEPGIIMMLYGNRGGIVITVEMTVVHATVLRDQLDEAIALMTAQPIK